MMENVMEKKNIHMIGNTHIDPVWLWQKAEGMQEVKSSFASALDRLDEFPNFKFTQSSISFLAWMKENCPEQFERIRARVAEGRWEIVGGMWVEPDCDLPSGEALIRHFLYSKKFVRENFDKDVVTAYNVDSYVLSDVSSGQEARTGAACVYMAVEGWQQRDCGADRRGVHGVDETCAGMESVGEHRGVRGARL